jgi:predicted dehydrogenase
MSDPLRVGIVGAGAVTQVAHLPVLKRMKVDVRALCDNDLPKARALGDRYGVKDVFDDIEDLLRYEELDAVVVCSPTHLHESHIQAALSANLHVLVEKPLTVSAASAQRIQRAVEKKRDRIVLVGMNHRYRPDVQIVRSFVQTGELGDIESARGSWHVYRPLRTQLGWRMRREQAGGGAMMDLGLTILDLGLWLARNPVPVRASAAMDRSGKDRVEQSGSAFVVCGNGFSLFLDVTWRHIGEGERFGVGIRGTRGTAAVNPLKVWKELHGVPADVAPATAGSRENPFTASFRAQWAHFQAAIAGAVPAPELEEQVTLHRLLDAIYKSAQDGRDVLL